LFCFLFFPISALFISKTQYDHSNGGDHTEPFKESGGNSFFSCYWVPSEDPVIGRAQQDEKAKILKVQPDSQRTWIRDPWKWRSHRKKAEEEFLDLCTSIQTITSLRFTPMSCMIKVNPTKNGAW
jgi:hypothetical protein